jgi:hypothetical protein
MASDTHVMPQPWGNDARTRPVTGGNELKAILAGSLCGNLACRFAFGNVDIGTIVPPRRPRRQFDHQREHRAAPPEAMKDYEKGLKRKE